MDAFSALVGGRGRWDRFERRIEVATRQTLDLLDRHGARATFFVVGWIAEQLPELIAEVDARGHEVANQGYSHRTIRDLKTPEAFRDDLIRSREAVERAVGRRVVGHRVPHFVGLSEQWALDCLTLEGLGYDSSLRPALHHFADRRFIHRHRAGGLEMTEVPISTVQVLGAAIPILGGNPLRQLPRGVVRAAINRWFDETSQPLVTYFHTWELDLDQPKLSGLSGLTRLRHYRHLGEVPARLEETILSAKCLPIAEFLGLKRPPVTHSALVPSTPIAVRSPAGGRESVTVVIPCYNESDALPYLQRTLVGVRRAFEPNYDAHFVFVDDGSTDDTVTRLENAFGDLPKHEILSLGTNQGVAAAIRAGIEAARTEVVCSMDCDCTYDPLELLKMIPKLTPGVALVTASPYHPRGTVKHVPGWRLLLSRGASALYQQVLHSTLHTFTSCFRVYRRSAVVDLPLEEPGFLGIAELLGCLLLAGEQVVEHPATLESRLFGVSKMKTLKTIGGHLRLLSTLGAARRQSRSPSQASERP